MKIVIIHGIGHQGSTWHYADLIVLTSPVYGMDVTGQMKALLDHLCYLWMSHRPDPAMFRKVGLIVSTTAGAGLGHAAKTMKNSMKFWGVKKILISSANVAAMGWQDVSKDKKTKIGREAEAAAQRIYKSVRDIERIPNPVFRSIFFRMMVGMEEKNDWNPKDRNHWEEQGWLSGKRPF